MGKEDVHQLLCGGGEGGVYHKARLEKFQGGHRTKRQRQYISDTLAPNKEKGPEMCEWNERQMQCRKFATCVV